VDTRKPAPAWCAAVFDSHPQLIVYPEETIFFRRYLPQADGLDLQGQLALAERTLIHIFRWNRLKPARTRKVSQTEIIQLFRMRRSANA